MSPARTCVFCLPAAKCRGVLFLPGTSLELTFSGLASCLTTSTLPVLHASNRGDTLSESLTRGGLRPAIPPLSLCSPFGRPCTVFMHTENERPLPESLPVSSQPEPASHVRSYCSEHYNRTTELATSDCSRVLQSLRLTTPPGRSAVLLIHYPLWIATHHRPCLLVCCR